MYFILWGGYHYYAHFTDEGIHTQGSCHQDSFCAGLEESTYIQNRILVGSIPAFLSLMSLASHPGLLRIQRDNLCDKYFADSDVPYACRQKPTRTSARADGTNLATVGQASPAGRLESQRKAETLRPGWGEDVLREELGPLCLRLPPPGVCVAGSRPGSRQQRWTRCNAYIGQEDASRGRWPSSQELRLCPLILPGFFPFRTRHGVILLSHYPRGQV